MSTYNQRANQATPRDGAETKPVVKLIGEDGNAYAIMGACQRAAKRAGWAPEKIAAMLKDMMSSDYDHLLLVAMDYFDVE